MSNHATLLLPDAESRWLRVRDGHPVGKALHRRHYSANPASSESKLYVGPGEKMVLLTPDAKAVFLWQKQQYRKDGQTGVGCAAFRNEGPHRSSELLLQAEAFAWSRWPGQRLYTYVNPAKLRGANSNPGCCFKKAGWKRCGTDKKGKLIFEKLPPLPNPSP